jgi:arsenate reductase-like glutaredoxin family protein
MNIVLYYRKKNYGSRNFPWHELCESPKKAVEFMDNLGGEYEFVPFEQITESQLGEMADELDD